MKYLRTLFFLLLLVTPNFIFADLQYGALDPPYWNGLVIVKDDTHFAFRFVIHKDNDKIDGYDTFYIVERVGPFSPDGRYAEISFNPSLPLHKGHETPILEKKADPSELVRMRYSKFQQGIIGSVEFPENTRIEALFYDPWEPIVNYEETEGSIVGESKDLKFYFILTDSFFKKIEKKDNTLSGMIETGTRFFYFYAGFNNSKQRGQKIERILNAASKVYQNARPRIIGEWEGLVASISNNLAWMRLYQPDKKRIYLPAGRRWIFPKPDGSPDVWTIFEWDAFFNALEAVVEDSWLAKTEIEAVLDCQYPTGNIPNWRSANSGAPDRSQPPVGSFAVLKTYYKTNDISILSDSYDRLKKWHEYWKALGINGNPRRDGNEDGLLEWGSDTDKLFKGMPEWEKGASGRQRAAWESGEDDLPNYDNVPFDEKKNTLMMNCIDLSSLYALDSEMMMEIASILGKKQDAEKFKIEYEAIKKKINQVLWDKDFYFDRFWDGKFSTHKAASNFYPMLAGAAGKDRVEKMVRHLLNEKEFWGDYVIPTISRDNPAFKDQQYWRGTIWPPTNYLVYQGLKRYKLDKIASEFAVKSASLFLKSWQTYGLCRENYNSVTGEGGGQRYQSWGPLFALILLEDFIDVTPFEGFRLGNLSASDQNSIRNIRLRGDFYTLEVDDQGLLLIKNKRELLKYKGKAVLRHLEVSRDTLAFEAHVIGEAVDFYPLIFQGKSFDVESEEEKVVKMKDFIRVPRGITKIVLKSHQ
ncbi:MAG: hypothetical protein JSV88_00415 [Candidatus Aminicenantes bacterium]|nr:MAG: hypothetical protein JSV88_00415 [Candidatus Aminicenantes bacterium]